MRVLSSALTRRQRFLVAWSARLVLLALVCQLAAADHWHVSPNDVAGIEHSSAHVLHCHGNAAGCADAASLPGAVFTGDLRLLPPPPLPHGTGLSTWQIPSDSYRAEPAQPPRAVIDHA